MKKTYTGSCHCGATRFQCELDLAPEGERSPPELPGRFWTATWRCNCSFCAKARYWRGFVRAKDFALAAGGDGLGEYRFGPGQNSYAFCRRCGIHLYQSSDFEFMGGPFYAVNINCLDGIPAEELAAAPVGYVDGRDDRFDRAPAVTSHL